jgi:uncharacterized protein DUF87
MAAEQSSQPIPNTAFRLEHGYVFELPLEAPRFSDENLLVGGGNTSAVDAIYLGKVAEFHAMHKNVWLDCEAAHAVYVMGKRRSGKSFSLGVLAEGLAAQGWIRQGDMRQGVLILDTMNVFLTMPYSVEQTFGSADPQTQETKKWGLNVLSPSTQFFFPKGSPPPPEGSPRELSLRACDLSGEEWAALFEVDTFSDPIGQLISEVYDMVAVEGYRTASQSVAANSLYTIDDLLRCIDDSEEVARFEIKTIEAVRRRLKAVKRTSVFSDTGLDVRELFVPGQISVLLLRDIDHDLRSLLIAVIVKKLMQLRSQSDKFERLSSVNLSKYRATGDENARKVAEDYEHRAAEGISRGWIIIDEAHNYIPARGILPSKEPLKKYVNEGRNLGLSIVVATQHPAALDPSIQRNADVLIIHSMSMRDDIAVAEGMVNTYIPDTARVDNRDKLSTRVFEQLVRSLPIGYALVSNDRVDRIFAVKMRPRLTVHGGANY